MWTDARTVTRPLDAETGLSLLSRARYGRLGASRRALPSIVPMRHVVSGGTVLLRTHRPWGHHTACDGAVVAFEAGHFDPAAHEAAWTVQVIGPARVVDPSREERALFGGAPASIDGEPYDPVHVRIEPRIVTGRTSAVPGARRAPDDM
ncbi:pyridoxamine 5'-phosphate oxidase family protein [Wenjunlia tyrosinilytica]|jgi:nitroimidazol reductase NimA-like FMN-containing flavoprotein (pyridoxamine 5'-phosphate oxidase superfamily)|uniref:Pyridoxamine 5'-phosphate oxidase family protein n=1 Tax=Wenjunlia tyrosinilytica TaxID=1544741 RepID=A0A917ZJK9_9ACTN|nr:pyridoxamine 5'-phosphate oxidase family protein [Wenjunlia tyrosinilytica]GGO84595.1 hypothetical protein GCM10012280_16420 [Wenjunlia tyrosinilytica]